MKHVLFGIAAVVLVAGCSTDKSHELIRANPVAVTDFLPGNERLVRRTDTFLVHYTWLDANAVVTVEFKNVCIAPFDLSYLPKGNGYDLLRDKLIDLDEAIKDFGEYGRNPGIRPDADLA